jgi:hypothetical protein
MTLRVSFGSSALFDPNSNRCIPFEDRLCHREDVVSYNEHSPLFFERFSIVIYRELGGDNFRFLDPNPKLRYDFSSVLYFSFRSRLWIDLVVGKIFRCPLMVSLYGMFTFGGGVRIIFE